MSKASRLRAIPWVLAVTLLVATGAGANRLINATDSAAGGAAGPGPTPVVPGGVVVLGTADADTGVVKVGPPALAALASVVEVKVKEGQEVKPGDALVQFDDRIPQAKLKEAKAELAAAEQDKARAELGKQNAAITLDRQQHAVKSAKDDDKEARDAYIAAVRVFDESFDAGAKLNGTTVTQELRNRRRDENPDVRRAYVLTVQAKNKVIDEEKKLAAAALLPSEAESTAAQAAAKVDRLKATVEQAAAAVDECVVRARVGGTIEQITVTPGETIGPATRGALMRIIPSGGRIVRAEVEPEFASKIADKIGKKVTVYDHNNFDITYEGVVRRVPTGYLPKRNAADSLVSNPTQVLEVVIDVPDPAPAGKPPLRVGQPVRVSFPDK
jgi:multidrug resistance efflux pump